MKAMPVYSKTSVCLIISVQDCGNTVQTISIAINTYVITPTHNLNVFPVLD